MHKKLISTIALLPLALLAACGASDETLALAPIDEEEPEALATLQQPIEAEEQSVSGDTSSTGLAAGQIIITTYFSDANYDTVIGSCIRSTCPGSKGLRCTGQKSPFLESDSNSCNGD